MTDREIDEKLRVAFGPDFRKARETIREVFSEYANEQWTPTAFLELITAAIGRIPPDATGAKVGLEGLYDETPKLIIRYRGLEDKATVAERVERAMAYARHALASERETYETLKAKYEGT